MKITVSLRGESCIFGSYRTAVADFLFLFLAEKVVIQFSRENFWMLPMGKKKIKSQNHYFSLSLKCLFAIFKSEKSSLIFLACQYINLSCNKNNTLAFIRQLLSTAPNTDAASVYKMNVRKKCLIILERVNTFLGIVNSVSISPKWTAVASDNWRFNLTAEKVSSGCALNSFVFGVNVYIYTVTINWYIFPQIHFSYWSSH